MCMKLLNNFYNYFFIKGCFTPFAFKVRKWDPLFHSYLPFAMLKSWRLPEGREKI